MDNPKTTIAGYLGLLVAVALTVKALLLGNAIDFQALIAAAGAAFPSIGAIMAKDGGH